MKDLPIDMIEPVQQTRLPSPYSDEWVYTASTMRAYGGSFAQHIGSAMLVADMSNRARLLTGFDDLLRKYGPDSLFYKQKYGK
jgi:hypothetical protein